MFNRVIMNVIHMPVQICIVADQVVPEASLPQGCIFLTANGFFIAIRKPQLDGLHDRRKILFPGCENPMEMIAQDRIRIHCKAG